MKQHQELLDCLELYRNVNYTFNLVANSYVRERRGSQIRQWKWLAQLIGLKIGIVTTFAAKSNTSTIFAHWALRLPLGLSQVLTAHIIFRNYLPSLPRLALRPQNVIPPNSAVIQACQTCDVAGLQQLLATRQAHPNDCTPEGLTVFRVSQASRTYMQSILD